MDSFVAICEVFIVGNIEVTSTPNLIAVYNLNRMSKKSYDVEQSYSKTDIGV